VWRTTSARPYTGKLSVSWPRTVAQEPINVGDPNYDPLFPYGYGLRTFGHGHGHDQGGDHHGHDRGRGDDDR
jgi:beta-glucosidase